MNSAQGQDVNDKTLTDDTSQAIEQCRAVAHMSRALAEVHEARALILQKAKEPPVEIIGATSAEIMEWLGDTLSGMDAVDGAEDAWMDPVFERAHARWPVRAASSGAPAATAGVPSELIARIDAAIQRIVDGNATMRIPADLTDHDLVLADCKRALLRAEQAAGVMPQIGPLLDGWDGMDNDTKAVLREEAPDMAKALVAISRAMDGCDAGRALTEERILHLWNVNVGDPTPSRPLVDTDKLAFARAIERELSPSTPAAGAGVAEATERNIPHGWALSTADFSVRAARGRTYDGQVFLVRDEAGRRGWHLLSEAEQKANPLYVSGNGKTFADALGRAILVALASTPQAASPTENLRLVGASGPLGDPDVLAASPKGVA